MTSVSAPPSQPYLSSSWTSISHGSSSFALSVPVLQTTSRYPRLCALRTGSDGGKFASQDAFGSDFVLRKPTVLPALETGDDRRRDAGGVSGYEESKGRYGGKMEGVIDSVDWENRILEETVPLVGLVKMILHSGKYESGNRLSAEHENTILEKLLRFHPESIKKIGSGIDYITIGYHPEYESSRCLFIVRKDGKLVDFSFWKCIKGLIRENYPLYADTFISRHFRSGTS
uniref:Uncharacterized protein n=1 Tax=Kalanchoe fedtschenkoi TaxID=63787 RepID=A0A7N0T3K7_KALFE